MTSLSEFLAQEESSGGTNPKAYKVDSKGTGKYQIGVGLYKDIQRLFPEFRNIPYEEATLNPNVVEKTREAGEFVINGYIKSVLKVEPTPALTATVWQQGIGNVKDAMDKAKQSGKSFDKHLGKLGQRRYNRATKALSTPDPFSTQAAAEERALLNISEQRQRAMGGF